MACPAAILNLLAVGHFLVGGGALDFLGFLFGAALGLPFFRCRGFFGFPVRRELGLFGRAAVFKRLQYARVGFVGLAGWIVNELLNARGDVVQSQRFRAV